MNFQTTNAATMNSDAKLSSVASASPSSASGGVVVARGMTAAVASIALHALLVGCAGTSAQTDGFALLSAPESKVPERRLVGTNSTPVHTTTQQAGRVQRADGTSSKTKGDVTLAQVGTASKLLSKTASAAATADQAASVNAPLFIGGGDSTTPETASTRTTRTASLDLPGAYLPTRVSDDEAPREGATNLAQVSFALEGGDFSPDIDRQATFMVYASTQHRSTFDLYRKSVDGRTVTLLTDDPSDDMMPAISPDGTTIAFASNRNGNWDIFTMPVSGGAPTQVTFDADEEVQPTWAPDGKRLAFSRLNGRSGAWEIWIIDTTATGVRNFVCEGFQPRWAPVESADKLLFQRARQRGSRLYGVWTIDLHNGEGIRPTEVLSASNAAILQPNWAPDGERIVFTTVTDPTADARWPERSDLWVINADGTGRKSLTRDQFRNMQPVWAEDGRVYFVSNRGGIENVWAVTVDRDAPSAPAPVAASRAVKPSRKVAGAPSSSKPSATQTEQSTETSAPAPDFLRAEQAGAKFED